MTIHIYDIDWDTSDFTEEEEFASGYCIPDLPKEIDIEVDPISLIDCDPAEVVEEALTDMYEFTVNGFNFEIMED